MPPFQLNDALWRCLCPSFSRSVIGRSLKSAPRSTIRCLRRASAVASPTLRRLDLATAPSSFLDDPSFTEAPPLARHEVDKSFFRSKGSYEPWFQDQREAAAAFTSPDLANRLVGERERALYKRFQHVGKAVLYSVLAQRAAMADKIMVEIIVYILIKERQECLDARHYTALMLSNANADLGSAAEAEKVFKGMEANGVPASSDVFHAALKVLAIHPDYLLRTYVLDKLQQYWFPLSHDGWQWVIIGLIRDKQMEMALDRFEEMRDLKFEPDAWFLNFFITSLLSVNAFPEAFSLLEMRYNCPEPIPYSLWDLILTTAAQSYAYPIVDFVWRRAVITHYINPSSGTCTDVLAVAARNGDFTLATDVMRVLGLRSSTIHSQHYESLVEAYLNANDLRTALLVLSIMTDTPTPPIEGGLQCLYQYLQEDPARPGFALRILRTQRKERKSVSIVTLNAILDVLGQHEALPRVLKVYREIRSYVPSGPTTATFNALFRGCKASGSKDEAMSLAAEMEIMKVAPDSLTYDRLILICVGGRHHPRSSPPDLDDGFKYWLEMNKRGWLPRKGTTFELIKGLTRGRDKRVWHVLSSYSARWDGFSMRKWVNENWPNEEDSGARRSLPAAAGELNPVSHLEFKTLPRSQMDAKSPATDTS